MKILKIESQNINSLKGKISIDFESFLKDETLFAITGATGAGKSTILDIITCALYGRTPRLLNPNSLMTQHTADSFCAVEFEIKGKRYRSLWSQRRARGRADGKLQTAKMEISLLDENKILYSKTKEVLQFIEELSGLDFDRFKQSMMLAQGEFDAFLKAKESERSILLEKITGTQIYAEISKEIYRNYYDLKKEIELERHALEGIRLLSPKEIKEKKEFLIEKNQDRKLASKRNKNLEKELAWLKELDKLQRNYNKYKANYTQIRDKKEKNQSSFRLLLLAQRALNMESLYNKRATILKDIEQDDKNLKTFQLELKELKVHLHNKKLEVEVSKKMSIDFEREYIQKSKKIRLLRVVYSEQKISKDSLDKVSKIVTAQKREVDLLRKSHNNSLISLKRVEKRYKDFNRKDNSYEERYQEMDKIAFKDNQREYPLKSKLKNIEEAIRSLKKYEEVISYQNEIDKKLIELKGKRKRLKERVLDKERLYHELESHLNSLQKTKERERLIVNYEKDRESLLEGEACFLCGSTTHPFINHKPDIDIDKSNLEIKEKKEELYNLKSELKLFDRKYTEVVTKIESNSLDFQKWEKKRLELKKSLRGDSLVKLEEEREFVELTLNEIIDRREKKIKLLEDKKKFEMIQKQLSQTLHEEEMKVKEFNIKIDTLKKSLEKSLYNESELKEKVLTLKKQAITILNVLDIDKYEKELTDKYEEAKDKFYQQERQYAELHVKEKGLVEQFNNLHEKLTKEKEELLPLDKQFLTELKLQGFKSERKLREAILTKDRRDKLIKLCSDIDKRYTEYSTLYFDIRKRLEKHKESFNSKASIWETEENRKAVESIVDNIQKEIGSIEKELEIDSNNQDRHQKQIEALEKKKKKFEVWIKLNEIVGSADGNKFAKFAQGITLDQLIFLANQYLKLLSSRYELQRSDNEKHLLEIEVIDSFQGNISRAVNTLSGGESFIVSLALALGLSNLASQKISIDTLFLDEGFGSLDEDSLEIALNALSQLQNSGKMIGVISHIKTLKERIALQIKVVPQGDGTSKVVIC